MSRQRNHYFQHRFQTDLKKDLTLHVKIMLISPRPEISPRGGNGLKSPQGENNVYPLTEIIP